MLSPSQYIESPDAAAVPRIFEAALNIERTETKPRLQANLLSMYGGNRKLLYIVMDDMFT